MNSGEIIFVVIAFAMAFSGALGVVLPFVPGVPAAWLGLLLFAYATHFQAITWTTLLIFLAFSLLTFVIDFAAPLIGAAQSRASAHGIAGALIGFAVGIFVFGPAGIIIGPLLGAFSGEVIHGKSGDDAMRASRGLLLGILAGGAIKLTLIFAMIGYMIFALF